MIGAMILKMMIPKTFEKQSRMDLEGMSKGWSDDVVLELSGPSVLTGRHEGRAAVEAFFRADWAQLRSSHIEAKRIALTRPYALGFTNVAMIEFVADVTSQGGASARIEGVSIVEVSRGKTVSIRNHYFDGTVIDRVYTTPLLEPQVAAAGD
jgi:ketosteroid isomerase-like protein